MFKRTALLVSTLFIGSCSLGENKPIRPSDAIIQGINYIGVTVSDIDETTNFYSETVNLRQIGGIHETSNPIFNKLLSKTDLKIKSKLLRSSNAQLRFTHFSSSSDNPKKNFPVKVQGPGFAHVCFQVNKNTKTYERFIKLGASPIGDPEMIQLNPGNPVWYAYARDLDKTMFEVEHVDIEQLNLKSPPKNQYRIRHVALATPNFDRSVKFYSELLEQDKPRLLGRFFAMSGDKFDRMSGLENSELKMAFFQVRNMELEIAQYLSHPTEVPTKPRTIDSLGYNMIVFDVSDLEMAKKKLLAAGGTLELDSHKMDGGQAVFGRDPDGNLLGFQKLDTNSPFSSKNFLDDGSI